MEIKVKNKGKSSMGLMISDINPSKINAIRRTIMAEVPVLAVEDVHFFENSSSLFDEMVALRIGLVPIVTDLGLFNTRESCKCKGEGCPSCTLKFTLEKEGPCTVYSDDLKSEDKKMGPIKGIPIVKLGIGQKLTLEADAILGTARGHAKWQPGIAAYKNYPEIKISKKCIACGDCVEACPPGILEIKSKVLKVTDKEACILCKTFVEVCDHDAIKIIPDENKYLFTVESFGQLTPEEMFSKACSIMEEKSEELVKLL